MCGYIVFYNENRHLEHLAVSKWNLTADEIRQLLLVTTVTLNVPKSYNDDEENDHEASTSTDTHRDQATVESSEHDKTRR